MKFEERRTVETVIISDTHLGTYGCHAEELVRYLKSVRPEKLILNGDIIDIWQFSKSYFPKDHIRVIKEIMNMLSKGVQVYYIPGNHDEFVRKFCGQKIGNLYIDNKVVLELDGKKSWIFHGDVFDVSMRYSKWIAKLGGQGYDLLILFNRFVNRWLQRFGKDKISLSKRVKDSVKAAVKHVNDFEATTALIGISNGYDNVICGHIHKPIIKTIKGEDGQITYMNSGDWIENLTSLEYNEGEWKLYRYEEDAALKDYKLEPDQAMELSSQEILFGLIEEFSFKRA
ncbi:MAG: UDP-2,3-diacylglucosamine diphosphatase [Flavobacteriales bacterium]|nr:UDP-2,3-diacylglucosamine diphosphatase [Flavobacteriales bacterium]